MNRLVYAEDVKNQIDDWLEVVGYCTIGKNLSYYGELLGCIEDAPTVDAVEVVRCEKCEYGYKRFMSDDAVVCGFDERIHNEKWFCAAGERRIDETD